MSIVFIITFNTTNKHLQDRLYKNVENTVSSLSLSLNTANADKTIIATMINASFDSANYSKISLVGTDKKVIYQRSIIKKKIDVPKWFINFVKIEVPIASATVLANWKQVGTLYVYSDISSAYIELYEIVKKLFISLVILNIFVMLILNLIIMKLLKPLKELQIQAEAIINNEFITQKNIPYTTEIKNVVYAMNNMVKKVQTMFKYSKEALKHQKELEYIDKVTQLKNRKYFTDKLLEYLKIDSYSSGGVAILIALNGVIEANQKAGRKQINSLFVNLANLFNEHLDSYDDTLVARINATEFIILIPSQNKQEALKIVNSLKESSIYLMQELNLDLDITYLSFGIYEYHHKETIKKFLTACDNALINAKLSKEHIFIDENKNIKISKQSWKKIIIDAIKDDKIELISRKVIDTKNSKLDHFLFSLILKNNKENYSYGQFMAYANQTLLSNDIYNKVIEKLLTIPNKNISQGNYAFRLSKEYLEDISTYSNLNNLLQLYAKTVTFNLIFELPDRFLHKNQDLATKYIKLFKEFNIQIGIYEFICESYDYQYLQDIKPIYIKADSSYFINKHYRALSTLRLITDTIGIKLIATGVENMQILKKLKEKEIYIIQGKIVDTYHINI